MNDKNSVIIVDDEEMLLDTLKSGLSSKGYYCEAVSTVKSALDLINKTSFEIMITDVVLPDGHGFELAKKAMILNPGMKVILMTGYSEDFSYDEAMEAGASDFIKKPFSLKELLARIKHIRMQEEFLRSQEELKKKVIELEEFYNMAVGRELRMKELKDELERLREELQKYKK
jgi:DNA-binding NtrC family response regulator